MSESGIPGRVVTALVGAGLVDPHRVDAAMSVVEQTLATSSGTMSAAEPRHVGPRLTEVAAYAGAALVVAAVILLGAQYWGDLTAVQRTLTLSLVAVLLALGALAVVRVAGGGWAPGRRLRVRPSLVAGTLVVAAAIASGVALGGWVMHTRYPSSLDLHNVSMTAGASLAILVLALGYLLAPSALLHLGLAAATVMLLTSVWVGEGYAAGAVRGVVVLVAAACWLALALTGRVWAEAGLGSAVGSLLLLFGAQLLLAHPDAGWAHATTLAVALVLFGLYWWRGEWPFLAVGVIALTTAVTEALIEWTDGSLGAGGAVLIAGLTLLAASGGAVLLRRRREHDHDGGAAPTGRRPRPRPA